MAGVRARCLHFLLKIERDAAGQISALQPPQDGPQLGAEEQHAGQDHKWPDQRLHVTKDERSDSHR